ncbi:GH25 family lysozyme [Mesobacillus foraminis]|uniref:GH25 family lysozyme n=1 Tax=Mesobacillus foraminis TaxID=279826 RepID=UPI0013CEF3F6|nr:GH25 family lysozyme [Mesobacillus foraminis]
MNKNLIADISHHQLSHNIDWAAAAKEVALMIIRVQYGSNTIDREYKKHVANCKKYKIPFGHYAYAQFVSVNDARDEAKHFLERIDKDAKFLVLDVEECTTRKDQIVSATQEFIDVCKKAGWKIGLYTGHHFYKPYGMDRVAADFLWLPRYGKNEGKRDIKPAYECDLWQYTDRGRVSWYCGNIDLNHINSSKTIQWFIGKAQKVSELQQEKEQISSKDSPSEYEIIKVKPGDTLSEIAARFHTTVSTLQKLNGIANPDKIYAGQKIRVR